MAVAALLGGPRHVGRKVKDSNDLVLAIRRGLPASSLERLAVEIEFPVERVAAAAGVTARTWARRRGKLLKPDESDRLVRLARIVAMARSVLGSSQKARDWRSRPHRGLSGQEPISLLDTDIGVGQVQAVLGRIAYGVHS